MAPPPLTGIKVLDLTRFQNGPSATKRLVDYGATVIKIEHPSGGDGGRVINTMNDGFDLFFQTFNRGKRSMTLDLRHPDSREVMHRLVQWADVLAENFRVGVLDRWGYSYDALKQINPRLIYASNSGFGPTGEWATYGCYDLVTQAYSGAMVAQGGGPSHPPTPVEWAMADEVGASNFAFSILTALLARERTGEGQLLQTSQLGAMLAFMGNGSSLVRTLHAGDGRQNDSGKRPFEENGWRQTYYQAADGKWFVVALIQEKDWLSLTQASHRLDLRDHPMTCTQDLRRQNTAWLKAELQRTFKGEDGSSSGGSSGGSSSSSNSSSGGSGSTADGLGRDSWVTKFKELGVICAPVLSYAEVASEEHNWENGYLTQIHHPEWGSEVVVGHPTRFSVTVPAAPGAAPALGQHTGETLTEVLGFSAEEVEKLRQGGAVGQEDGKWQDKTHNKRTKSRL